MTDEPLPEEHYTHGHHESVLRSHIWRTALNSAAYLLPHLRPGMSILDVGAGPGTITVDLAELVAPGRVVGVDASAEVVEQARRHAAERGVTNVEFVVADAYALPYADGEFDVVHAHQVLQHLARPVDALREWRRVVGSDGFVGVRECDYGGVVTYPTTPGLASWAGLYQQVHRSNGGEPDAGRRLKAWARSAGFAAVDSTASVWCFATDDERAWWGGMWRDRVLASAFAGDALGKGFASRADLEAISYAWAHWAEDPDGWMVFPHGEIIARA
ncbi:class I SAM-dependent methyltransferase [Protaetiibacter mangrovi]|uniref:Class I SAM-dependent methyltransferase n=1 Tax=Protaetiibacter mangrovi TaxID=2970926 RepID=A0ABT1ZEK7_9MICO|nr:class I SAM-dependent methyltransferase [Protaetiibacter mangrovi]MCS0499142.1 class I SAM-dependent methyltransferase [Protaetiibacter mangrovi]TPX03743.1 methyltransferase domain-containing protein [Schumannella luteola]